MRAVDVVVPCYRYDRYLEGCVATILSQRDVEVRVLIVDDASPDDTPAVAARLVAADPRVTYIRNVDNLGLVGTANRGVIDWATAPYTLLLSADDALTPGALARAVDVLEANPDAGMVYGMAMVVGEMDGEHQVQDQAEFDFRVVSGPAFLKRFCGHGNQVASPTAVVRTELQHKIGGYNPIFPHTCDVEMWMRFATQASVAVINAPQAYYRWHASNMSAAYINRPLNDISEQLDTVIAVKRDWGAHIAGYEVWLAQMTRRFAVEACWLAGLAHDRGDQAARGVCLDYAKAIYPRLWRLPGWWRCQAKMLIGAQLSRKLKGAIRGEVEFARSSPFTKGGLFGWWPEAS